MKTLAVFHQKKTPAMPYLHKKHITLPHFFQYTILLWILFGTIILMIFPIFLVAKLYKIVKRFFGKPR